MSENPVHHPDGCDCAYCRIDFSEQLSFDSVSTTGELHVDAEGVDSDDLSVFGAVPNAELEDLVADWRESQDDCDLPRSGLTGEGYVYKQCADRLEALIEEHTDD